MGSLWSSPSPPPPPPLSKDELTDLRKARIDYQDYLSSTQTSTTTDVNNNAITPETGKSILSLIQTSYTWLKNNPNARLNELYTSQDASKQEIKRLLSTDGPKRSFHNTILALPTILTGLVKNKTIPADKVTAFQPSLDAEKEWYTKNQATATEVDFSQEKLKLQSAITSTFVDQVIINEINQGIQQSQNLSQSELQSAIHTQQKAQEKAAAQVVDVKSGRDLAISIAFRVFKTLLMITLCIMAGSFAANMAIGRIPAYRILYFIYGAIPVFAPFVLVYTIFKRIQTGRLHTYAILPISIDPATTNLGRFLWHPFYWVPDQYSMDMYNEYMASLPLQVLQQGTQV